MTTAQAAALLGITRGRVLHLIASGILRATKQGRDWHITERSVEAARGRKGAWKKKATKE